MQPMETLSDLLQQLQGQYRIYDMGCRLSKLSSTDFKKFEEGQKAYPLPVSYTHLTLPTTPYV